jgi:DNA invertase Pin-like site-specific DNA recombinase
MYASTILTDDNHLRDRAMTQEIRVHSYGRFSDESQGDGDSEPRQERMFAAFLRTNPAYVASDLRPFDHGKSGFKGNKQKALNEFLAIMRAKDGRIRKGDILFVEAVDRLSRKGIGPTQDTVNEIMRHGVSIATGFPAKIYRAGDRNNLGDAVELAAKAYGAHDYSLNLSRRLKEFHAEEREAARSKGRPVETGSAPFWLQRMPEGTTPRFQIRPGAQEVVDYIFRRTIEGAGGKMLIKELNQKFPPIGRAKRWTEQYMRSIMQGRRILGEMQLNKMVPKNPDDEEDGREKKEPQGPVIKGYYPALVDEETWQQAQAAINNRRIERGPNGKWLNLWTGLLWNPLDKCAINVWTYRQKRADGRTVIFRRLKSQNAADGRPGACTETICVDQFSGVILKWLRELDTSVFTKSKSQAVELQALIDQRGRKEKRIAEIEADESGAVAVLTKQLVKLSMEVEELTRKIEAMKVQQAQATPANLHHIAVLEKLDNTPENRQLLREAIKRVVKRISILPVKLGSKRMSPVGSLIEIELTAGPRRQLLQLGAQAPIAYSQSNPDEPALTDLPAAELKRRQAGVRKFLLGFVPTTKQ